MEQAGEWAKSCSSHGGSVKQRRKTQRGAGKLGKSWRIREKNSLRSDFSSRKAKDRIPLEWHTQLCESQEVPFGKFWDEERLPQDWEGLGTKHRGKQGNGTERKIRWGKAGAVLSCLLDFILPLLCFCSCPQNRSRIRSCPCDKISHFLPKFSSSRWDGAAPVGSDLNWRQTLKISDLFLKLSPPFFPLSKTKMGKKEGEQERGIKILQNEGIPKIPQ